MSRNPEHRLRERQRDNAELQQAGDNDRSKEVWVREQSEFGHRKALAATTDGEKQLRERRHTERDRAGTSQMRLVTLVSQPEPQSRDESDQSAVKEDQEPVLGRDNRFTRRARRAIGSAPARSF